MLEPTSSILQVATDQKPPVSRMLTATNPPASRVLAGVKPPTTSRLLTSVSSQLVASSSVANQLLAGQFLNATGPLVTAVIDNRAVTIQTIQLDQVPSSASMASIKLEPCLSPSIGPSDTMILVADSPVTGAAKTVKSTGMAVLSGSPARTLLTSALSSAKTMSTSAQSLARTAPSSRVMTLTSRSTPGLPRAPQTIDSSPTPAKTIKLEPGSTLPLQEQLAKPLQLDIQDSYLSSDDGLLMADMEDNGSVDYKLLEDGSCKCNLCGEVTQSRTHWYRHKYKVHDVCLFRCDKCQIFFKSKKGYEGHVNNRHQPGRGGQNCSAAGGRGQNGSGGAGPPAVASDGRPRTKKEMEGLNKVLKEIQAKKEAEMVQKIIEKVKAECMAQG